MLLPSSKTIAGSGQPGAGAWSGHHRGGPDRGADGADAPGAQHGLGLAGGGAGAHEDSQAAAVPSTRVTSLTASPIRAASSIVE